MKTSTLLIAAAGVGALALVVVMARSSGAVTAPAAATPAPVAPRPKDGRQLLSYFDPTSSTSPFGGQVRDLIGAGLGSIFAKP